MKINWKQKLSSRKFWAAVAGVILNVCVIFGVSDITTQQIIALVTASSTLIIYIVSEGFVDASNTNTTTTTNTSNSEGGGGQ